MMPCRKGVVEVMDILFTDFITKIDFGELQSFKNLQIIPHGFFKISKEERAGRMSDKREEEGI
ncbi:MAG: hypothetical protein IMZ41_00215 [Actinobacteria bacterium]|nr:hypothetical protein [Actinomycetota bacterium]